MKKILDKESSGINQLLDSRDTYPIELWKKACANNWMPQEINMSDDIKQWKSDLLSADEKLLVKRLLGFFSGAESLVGNNLLLSVFKYVTDGGCRQYILRQGSEEALHNETISVCCAAYNLDIKSVSEAYLNIPTIKAKDDFLLKNTSDINRQDFDITTQDGKREFLKNLFIYYVVCEGTFFFSGFAMALALGRQNKMVGLCDQIKYTLRDESLHIQFGTHVINRIKTEYPEIWDDKLKGELIDLIKKAVELEIEYAKDVLPRGILGLNSTMFVDYMQFIGNRRLEAIGLDFRFPSDKNPFPWLGEIVDVQAMGAFFERRERSYQQAGALNDDF